MAGSSKRNPQSARSTVGADDDQVGTVSVDAPAPGVDDYLDNTAVEFNEGAPPSARTAPELAPVAHAAPQRGGGVVAPGGVRVPGAMPMPARDRAYAATLTSEDPIAMVPTALDIAAPPPARDFDREEATRKWEPAGNAPAVAPARAPSIAPGPGLHNTGVQRSNRGVTAKHSAVPVARAKGTKEDPFALIGHALERRFRIERLVAEGGYGAVYYGTHLTLERPIALKVLKSPPHLEGEARREFMDKFVAEAKVIARLGHPAIVQVLDTDVSVMPTGEPAPWMALEWLEGRPLESFLREQRGRRLAPRDALRALRPVIDALSYAHGRGIAHRDVKPGNIVLVPDGPVVQLKLLDFGIAKVMQPNEEAATAVTRNASVNYSPHYAAPEQVAGMRTGPWTDVHAVALLLTELLVGAPAYRGGDLSELMSAALNPQRPTPRALGVDVGHWEPVLEKAMAFKAADRFQHMRELLLALEQTVPAAESAGPIPLALFDPSAPPLEAPGYGAPGPVTGMLPAVGLHAPPHVAPYGSGAGPYPQGYAAPNATTGVLPAVPYGGAPAPVGPFAPPAVAVVARRAPAASKLPLVLGALFVLGLLLLVAASLALR